MRPPLRRGRFPYPATRSIGNGCATILISEANIRFRILNRDRYVRSSKNCGKRISLTNSNSRQRMPCLSSLSRNDRRNMFLHLRPRRSRRQLLLFRTDNGRSLCRKQSLPHHSRRISPLRGTVITRRQIRNRRHSLLSLACRLEHVISNGAALRNPALQIGTRSSTVWRQRLRRGTIPEKH